MRYFNYEFHRNTAQVLIVEGQADAISLGQWGYSAVALCGVSADAGLAETLKKCGTKYAALDDDKAGRENIIQVAQTFGAMTRLLKWESAAAAPKKASADAEVDEDDALAATTDSGEVTDGER